MNKQLELFPQEKEIILKDLTFTHLACEINPFTDINTISRYYRPSRLWDDDILKLNMKISPNQRGSIDLLLKVLKDGKNFKIKITYE